MLRCLVKEEDQLTQEEIKQLEELLVPLFSWSYHFSQSFINNHTLYYSSKPKWRLLLYDGKELIGTLSIVERKISSHYPLIVGGLGNLCIKESHQGKNLSACIFKKVHEFMREEGINMSLLFCVERLKGLYIRLGYQQTVKPVLFHQEGKTEEESLALFYPISVTLEQVNTVKQNGLDIGQGTW